MGFSETTHLLNSCTVIYFFNNQKLQKVYLRIDFTQLRSSRLEVFSRKRVLRNFAKFTGKHMSESLFFNKNAGRPTTLLKKRMTLA